MGNIYEAHRRSLCLKHKIDERHGRHWSLDDYWAHLDLYQDCDHECYDTFESVNREKVKRYLRWYQNRYIQWLRLVAYRRSWFWLSKRVACPVSLNSQELLAVGLVLGQEYHWRVPNTIHMRRNMVRAA